MTQLTMFSAPNKASMTTFSKLFVILFGNFCNQMFCENLLFSLEIKKKVFGPLIQIFLNFLFLLFFPYVIR